MPQMYDNVHADEVYQHIAEYDRSHIQFVHIISFCFL